MIPVKTGDLVHDEQGRLFVIKSIDLSAGAPIADLMPVSSQTIIKHVSEIELVDKGEKTRRIKAMNGGELPKIKSSVLSPKITLETFDTILSNIRDSMTGQ